MTKAVSFPEPNSIEGAHRLFCEFVEREGLNRAQVARACLWYADQAERFNLEATAASYRDSAQKTKRGVLPIPNPGSIKLAGPATGGGPGSKRTKKHHPH